MGNKAAVFPLQLLGFDVDVVNSVHFSNHTGYAKGLEGDVLGGDQLRSILKGLERNSLLGDVGHLLTGFIGSESFLKAVLDVLKTLRSTHPVRFVCDPVLGDAGRFYVPPELVDVYKKEVIPLADVVTPNQFEVEQLTGITVKTTADSLRACKALHDMGPSLVFITSMVLEDDDDDNERNLKMIAILASRRRKNDKDDEVWRIDSPLLEGQFTGTGDLCAALLLGHTAANDCLPSALEKVIGTMSSVISRTAKARGDTVASRELQLVNKVNGILKNHRRHCTKHIDYHDDALFIETIITIE